MDSNAFTESVVKDAALAWLKSTCWQVAHVLEVAPDMPAAERKDCSKVLQER